MDAMNSVQKRLDKILDEVDKIKDDLEVMKANEEKEEKSLLKRAVKLYMNNQLLDAFPLFMKLAKEGNPRACYFVGVYYICNYSCIGLKENKDLGLEYERKGMEEDPLCEWAVANFACEEDSDEAKQAIETAFPKVMKLAQKGDPIALNACANYYSYKKDTEEAIKWRQKAIDRGFKGVSGALGLMVEEKDKETALKLYLQAYKLRGARAGVAATCIGDVFYNDKNYSKAIEWYQRGAEEQFPYAMVNLATMYKDGVGLEKDSEKAKALYERAYRLHGENAGEAANLIGIIYYNEGKYDKAIEWYKKGSAEGFPYSMANLGGMYNDGTGVGKDIDIAKAWYMRAYDAHGDNAGDVANSIGSIYYDNEKYEKAIEWFRKGAEGGSLASMFNLGLAYGNGNGVEKDIAKAIEWYEKVYNTHADYADEAAEKIGNLYDEKENSDEAKKWKQIAGKGQKKID